MLRAGPRTALRGLPRHGSLGFGVPPGGAFDQTALFLANLLLRNADDALALEVDGYELALEATNAIHFVVLGSDRVVEIGTREVRRGQVTLLAKGEILTARPGRRVLLAFAGGLTHVGEGARSPSPPSGSEGDSEPPLLFHAQPHPCPNVRLDLPKEETGPLRFIWGPEAELFDQEVFLNTEFLVSRQLDRKGIRLECPPLVCPQADRPSELQLPGTIQVPPEGKPVILGPDGPTIGGYPRIGVVIRADLDRLATLSPGIPIQLRQVEIAEAREAWTTRLQRLERRAKEIRLASSRPPASLER